MFVKALFPSKATFSGTSTSFGHTIRSTTLRLRYEVFGNLPRPTQPGKQPLQPLPSPSRETRELSSRGTPAESSRLELKVCGLAQHPNTFSPWSQDTQSQKPQKKKSGISHWENRTASEKRPAFGTPSVRVNCPQDALNEASPTSSPLYTLPLVSLSRCLALK